MATINTIADLLQTLDEHPQWLEAVRERLLTEDIREAPRRLDAVDQRLNSLIAKIDDYIEKTNQQLKGHEERLKASEEQLKASEKRLKASEEQLKAINRQIEITNKRLDRQEETIKRHFEIANKRFEHIEETIKRHFEIANKRFDRQERDIAYIKGEVFERRVRQMSGSLAQEMGLTKARTMATEELNEMVDIRDTSDIAPGRLKSFRAADLVLEGVDQKGGPCYTAVEVSYTVDERDTVRAVSAAQLLTRFTGLPARAAVAGVRSDDCIQGQIESGEVFYWAIDEDDALPR